MVGVASAKANAPSRSPMTRLTRASCALLLQALAFAAFAMLTRADAAWRRTEWRGERAWIASSGGWTAIVSEERARLVSLAPEGGGADLLYAEQKDIFSWGGHRFWLGPQTAWTAPWPPPADWERSAAAEIVTEGDILRVKQARAEASYPEIERAYVWRDGVLSCTVSWRDARFQGIHIVQVPKDATVLVRREASEAAPLGYVLLPIYKRPGLRVNEPLSSKVATIAGDSLTLRYGGVREKVGVPPQPIVAEMGAYRLTLRRGEMSGMSETKPDIGMLTQAYFGSAEDPFIEIEQLTPLGAEGGSRSEILLEPSVIK